MKSSDAGGCTWPARASASCSVCQYSGALGNDPARRESLHGGVGGAGMKAALCTRNWLLRLHSSGPC